MVTWECTIPGEPIGKGRPRFAARLGRARAFTPPKTRGWEAMAAMLMRAQWRRAPLEGPVTLDVTAVFPRPQRLLRASSPGGRVPHTAKPDRDNIEKLIADSLEKAGVLKNDSQVWSGETRKLYAAKGEEPHVLVRVASEAPDSAGMVLA